MVHVNLSSCCLLLGCCCFSSKYAFYVVICVSFIMVNFSGLIISFGEERGLITHQHVVSEV